MPSSNTRGIRAYSCLVSNPTTDNDLVDARVYPNWDIRNQSLNHWSCMGYHTSKYNANRMHAIHDKPVLKHAQLKYYGPVGFLRFNK